MFPILRALKERLLNEPVFFLGAVSAVALAVRDEIPLPTWVKAGAIVVFTIATRSVVTPRP